MWGIARYRPDRHDAIVYTAVSRLRGLLGTCGHWVESRDGAYRLAAVAFRGLDGGPAPDPPEVLSAASPGPRLPRRASRRRGERVLLAQLAQSGPRSTAEIATALEVSEMTAFRTIRGLLDRGLADEDWKGTGHPVRGCPSRGEERMMRSMQTVLATAALAAPLLLGCGAASSAVDAILPGAPVAFSGAGVYTVPAVPTVTFAIEKVKVEQAGGSVTVYYDLPAVFAAQSSDVKLTGPADGTASVDLSGDEGTSRCTVASGVLTCHEDLSGLQFDPAQAMADPPASAAVAAAVAAFQSEPIGVLTVAFTESSIAPSSP